MSCPKLKFKIIIYLCIYFDFEKYLVQNFYYISTMYNDSLRNYHVFLCSSRVHLFQFPFVIFLIELFALSPF